MPMRGGAEESRVIHRNFYAGARAPKLRISLTGHWASMPDAAERVFKIEASGSPCIRKTKGRPF